ncbi:Cutinase multi-domain protein [Pyrenophora tritici-repentis]|nr:Cutinase multi-domain protein [Pyrenophora tritici-repentis]
MSLVRKTLAMGAFSALAAAQAPKTTADCLDAVIFNTRGNNAPYHDWRTAPLLDAVCAKLNAEGKTCDYIDVEFDAPLGGDYCAQVAQGVRNGVAELTAYNKKCPCTHIIISGYSEGAHILGDILAGPGGCNFVFEGLDNTTRPGNAIAAAMLWGDALHVAGQPYNVLDGANKQKSPRNPTELARLNRYSNVLRSWCDAKDPVCAGGNDGTAHSTYFMKYSDSAADWASAAAASSGASSGASKPTAAASSSGAPTATKTGSAPPAESTCAKANFPAPIPYEEKCVQVVTIKYVQAKKPM